MLQDARTFRPSECFGKGVKPLDDVFTKARDNRYLQAYVKLGLESWIVTVWPRQKRGLWFKSRVSELPSCICFRCGALVEARHPGFLIIGPPSSMQGYVGRYDSGIFCSDCVFRLKGALSIADTPAADLTLALPSGALTPTQGDDSGSKGEHT